MNRISIQHYQSPAGELLLGSLGDALCLCDWRYRRMRSAIDARIKSYLNAEYIDEDSPVLEEARSQLEDYFTGERKEFNLPILTAGTPFQKRVWQALLEIPHGQTVTYATLAHTMDQPKAVRAVASANGANALSIIVPCHRVIGAKRELVGYAGGLAAKHKLLELEGAETRSQQAQGLLF